MPAEAGGHRAQGTGLRAEGGGGGVGELTAEDAEGRRALRAPKKTREAGAGSIVNSVGRIAPAKPDVSQLLGRLGRSLAPPLVLGDK